MIERMASSVGEYSHVRKWQEGTLTNSRQLFGAPIRLPDTIIFLSTLTSVFVEVWNGIISAEDSLTSFKVYVATVDDLPHSRG